MDALDRIKKRHNFMEYKSVVGVYYNGKLQQTFLTINDADKYIAKQQKDPNCEPVKFTMKVLERRE